MKEKNAHWTLLFQINMSENAYLDNMLQLVKLGCIYDLASLHVENLANET